MNVWRWLGLSIVLLGALCLVGATKLPVYAGGKEKDKAQEKDKKADEKDKKAEEKKKDDTKTEDKKTEVPKAGALEFKAFKYNKDSAVFYQLQTTKTKQKMKVMGQEVEQNQDQTFLIEWTVMPEKDGNYVVQQKIAGVEMTINIGGNKIGYDSRTPEDKQPNNPMTQFFAQLRKNPLTFTIKPDLTVSNIEGRDKFIKDLGAINPQMQGLLNAILSDEALKKMAEPTWYAFPKGGVIPESKTWDQTSTLNLGPIGTYKTKFVFIHKGPDGANKDKDKIEITTKLEYTPPSDKAGLPFIIHAANLKSDTGTGEAIFDRVKGRFVSTEIKMKLTGTLDIEVGNMKTSVDLDQTQTATSTISDARPTGWEEKAK